MKKKMAAMLCALMGLTAFTGCSADEIGYMEMNLNMLQAMQSCETVGNTEITLNFDEMKSFANTIMTKNGTTLEEVIPAEDLAQFQGSHVIDLDYTAQMDMTDLSFVFDIDATYNNKEYSFGQWYYSLTEGMYISSETVWSAYQMEKDSTNTSNGVSLYQNTDFENELKAIVDANPYICLVSAEELSMNQAVIPENGMQDLYQAAVDMYLNAFEGYTSNLVTKTDAGSYKIEATGTEVGNMLVSMLDYVAQNPETVLNAVEEYLTVSMQTMGTDEAGMADLKDSFAAAKADMDSFSAMITGWKSSVETAMADPSVASVLEGFHYLAEVSEKDGVYTSAETYTMNNGTKLMCSIDSTSTMQATSKVLTFPTQSISMTDIGNQLTALVNKYNPVVGITVKWYPADGDNVALVSSARAEQIEFIDATMGTDVTIGQDYVVQDGRIYLPLRALCDTLGETVVWDAQTRTASVVQGEETIQMDSILVDGVSYIGVRGFEALGYTVDYTNNNGEHIAVITQ